MARMEESTVHDATPDAQFASVLTRWRALPLRNQLQGSVSEAVAQALRALDAYDANVDSGGIKYGRRSQARPPQHLCLVTS